MQMIDISRLRIISTCSTCQIGGKDLIGIENIKACLFSTPCSIPLLCFWILGANEKVEDIVCGRPNFLNYGHCFRFVETCQVKKVGLLVKLVEDRS